jgi:hypothetical protein
MVEGYSAAWMQYRICRLLPLRCGELYVVMELRGTKVSCKWGF